MRQRVQVDGARSAGGILPEPSAELIERAIALRADRQAK
jgi:hypothetical protein